MYVPFVQFVLVVLPASLANLRAGLAIVADDFSSDVEGVPCVPCSLPLCVPLRPPGPPVPTFDLAQG